MSKVNDYRGAMDAQRPSPGWRARTLAAMEAAGTAPVRPARPRRLLRAAAATACAVLFAGGLWWGLSLPTHTPAVEPSGTPGVARTPAPAHTPPADVWSLPDAGSWITIVEDPAQQMESCPTAGRLDELTELPIYRNPRPTEEEQRTRLEELAGALGRTVTSTQWREGTAEPSQGWAPALWADGSGGETLRLHGQSRLELLDAASSPVTLYGLYPGTDAELWDVESAVEYSYDGSPSVTRTFYYRDPDAPLAQQLYDYSFRRFSIRDGNAVQLTLPPGDPCGVYPICTAEEAVARFRSGDYWSTMETDCPERAELLQVTLEYATQDYQTYFQPVYRILFTQDYWDTYVEGLMHEGVDASRFAGVAAAYVPAMEGLNFQMYANDSEVHRTPS